MTNDSASRPSEEWTPERVAAERRKVLRQTWIVLGILAALFFGLLDYRYEQVKGASGKTYRVADAGRHWGTDWQGSYFHYFSSANDQPGRDREMADLSATMFAFAERNGDDGLRVGAVDRLFRYGLFHVDRTYSITYRRVEGRWFRE